VRGVLGPLVDAFRSRRSFRIPSATNGRRQNGHAGARPVCVFSMIVLQHGLHKMWPAEREGEKAPRRQSSRSQPEIFAEQARTARDTVRHACGAVFLSADVADGGVGERQHCRDTSGGRAGQEEEEGKAASSGRCLCRRLDDSAVSGPGRGDGIPARRRLN
jgi:hypothetical protein